MHAILMAAMAAVGVDVGWQPAEQGQTHYIIQIEPHQLKNLQPGDTIDVGVRPQLRQIRSFQIVVGDAELPRIEQPPQLSLSPVADLTVDPAATTYSWAANRYPVLTLSQDPSLQGEACPPLGGSTATAERPPAAGGWTSSGETPPPATPPAGAAAGDPPVAADLQRKLDDLGGSVVIRSEPAEAKPPRPAAIDAAPADLSRPADPAPPAAFPPFDPPKLGPLENRWTTTDPPSAESVEEVGEATAEGQESAELAERPESGPAELDAPPREGDVEGRAPLASPVPPQRLLPEKAPSLEEVRREMARSWEDRVQGRPPASDPVATVFPVPNAAAPVAGSETTRVAAIAPVGAEPAGPAGVDLPAAPASGLLPSGEAERVVTERKVAGGELAERAVAEPSWLPLALGSSRPHLFLTLSVLALFASLGGNLYLGWITLDLRRRFHHSARTRGVRS